MDPLAKAYLKVITESSDELQKGQDVKGYTPKEGEAFGDDTNAKKLQPKSGPESKGTEDVENPEENKELSVDGENDGKVKPLGKNYAESKNPFDMLFNKIISEEGEMMDFSTGESPEDSTFEPSMEREESDEFGLEDEEGNEGEEITITLNKELAQQLHDILSQVLTEGEHEEGESEEEESSEHEMGGEEFGEEGEEGEEESFEGGAKPFGEATEMQELGTPITDTEKLAHGLHSKGSYTVKGAVPVTKKTAQTPATGKGHDGKLKAHSTSGGISKLQSKKQDVGGVKVGKTLFDND
jgi:hypothetical protein